jgi:hypothetical protein
MILRVGVADAKESTARLAVATAARGCRALFQEMRTAWNQTVAPDVVPKRTRPKPSMPSAPQVTVKKIG